MILVEERKEDLGQELCKHILRVILRPLLVIMDVQYWD